MKHLRRYNESTADDIKQDIKGLLIELVDDGRLIIQYDKTYEGGVLLYVYISSKGIYYRENDMRFSIRDIYEEVKTVEEYLLAHQYKFIYVYELYTDDDDDNIVETSPRIDHIEDLDDILMLTIKVFNK